MKDYWRLIGVAAENATSDQIRQAHFRAFRFYQGQKNNSRTEEQRAEAERVIDYLRRAQHNPDLPLQDSLKHLLPPLPQAPAQKKSEEIIPPVAPTAPIELPKSSFQTKPIEKPAPTETAKPIDVEVFEDPDIKRMAQDILGSASDASSVKEPLLEESIPPTDRLVPPTEKILIVKNGSEAPVSEEDQSIPDTDELILDGIESVDEDLSLEPALDEEPSKESLETQSASAPIEDKPKDAIEAAPRKEPAKQLKSVSGRYVLPGEVINCPYCEWEIISQTDNYCSGCGKSITSVAAPDELILYIGETGSYAKTFQITNNGLIPIVVDAMEVIDIDASIEPNEPTVVAKNESITALLRVSETNPFGKRSGGLRFCYNNKPFEIPIQLKEPPNIWLSFPDVPNARIVTGGFLLRLSVNQRSISCVVNTNSDIPLEIDSITLGGRLLAAAAAPIRQKQPRKILIEDHSASDLVLTVVFRELGSRQFRLSLHRVETPNLVDRLERFSIGEDAIMLGSGLCENSLTVKNEIDVISGRGKGRAEQIEFQGAPQWLAIEPSVIANLASGESVQVRLKVDSDKISKPGRERVNLAMKYYDPQLECMQERTEPVQLPFEFIQPRKFDDWIAVDFGTSNSCAAVVEGTVFRSLKIDDEAFNSSPHESPTCIQFVDDAAKIYECGMSAYSKRFSGPRATKSTVWAFKPQLSRSTEPAPQTYLDMQGRPHTKTIDELIMIYARGLIEGVKLRNGILPRKAVVTYPVTFGKRQRERLAAAFRAAGFEEAVTPVSEPVALAIHYAYLHREVFLNPAVFAVFDFGGGTTDLAIFHINPSTNAEKEPELRLLDVSGIDIGGELLTFEIARMIYELLVSEPERGRFLFPANLDELAVGKSDAARENYSSLADLAERVKRTFHSDPSIFEQEISKSLFDGDQYKTFKTRLSLKDIEELLKKRVSGLIESLIEMVSALKERGAIAERKLDWMILGGNSSKLPLVTEMLSDALFQGNRSRVLLDAENMKFGVTKGALLYAVAPEALPFPIDMVNQTLPCRVGLLGAGFSFEAIFERGIVAGGSGSMVRRRLKLSQGQDYLRLYLYFGHEANPKMLGNPKMKEYQIPCAQLSGGEVDASFQLLPNSEGIEVVLHAEDDRELKHVVPI